MNCEMHVDQETGIVGRIFVWYYFLTNFTCIILNCKINFFEGVKQIANVAALSGIVEKSVGLPDILAGYGN